MYINFKGFDRERCDRVSALTRPWNEGGRSSDSYIRACRVLVRLTSTNGRECVELHIAGTILILYKYWYLGMQN